MHKITGYKEGRKDILKKTGLLPKEMKLFGRTNSLPKFKAFGKKPPRGILSDKDRDMFPDPIDCQPNNPKKQGFLGYTVGEYFAKKKEEPKGIRGKIGRVVQKYREYKAKAPERVRAKTEVLEAKEEQEIVKARIQQKRKTTTLGRLELQKQRLSLMKERRKAMGQVPSMLDSGRRSPQMPSFSEVTGIMPTTPSPITSASVPTQTKRRKRRKKKKKK
jgi:hypothetical protein